MAWRRCRSRSGSAPLEHGPTHRCTGAAGGCRNRNGLAEVTPQAQIWDAGLRPLARDAGGGAGLYGWEKEEVVMRRIRAGETTVEIFDLNA